MFYEGLSGGLWSIECLVLIDDKRVARIRYIQERGGWRVVGGGWGDRNSKEVIEAGLKNLLLAAADATFHSSHERDEIVSQWWLANMKRTYGHGPVGS